MQISTPNSSYFQRLASTCPTEFWINNATEVEAEAAIAAGAVCATTNPTYMARLLKEEPEYVRGLIDQALKETQDSDGVAERVLLKAVGRLQQLFLPLFKSSGGKRGLVAIQGDPRVNTKPDAILESAIRYRQLGENIAIKVPAWPAGAITLEQLVEIDVPTIATLGFSVDQAVYMAEVYRKAVPRSNSRPPCYVTFIAGVLDTYLADFALQRKLAVSKQALFNAGCAASRVAYRIYKSRGYEAILLGGGARGPHHFTELVGGELAVTIGWRTAQQIIAADSPTIARIDAETPLTLLSELEGSLPDFSKSAHENSMVPEDFAGFGPVAAFQSSFLAGMDSLLKAISERRSALSRTKAGRY